MEIPHRKNSDLIITNIYRKACNVRRKLSRNYPFQLIGLGVVLGSPRKCTHCGLAYGCGPVSDGRRVLPHIDATLPSPDTDERPTCKHRAPPSSHNSIIYYLMSNSYNSFAPTSQNKFKRCKMYYYSSFFLLR